MSRKVVTAVVWLVVAGPVVALLVWEALPHHHHGPVGPHGGPLADWGGGGYHLELVAEPGEGRVTVYVLDRTARTPRAIDAAAVTLSAKADPAAVARLAPDPEPGDPAGRSSRYSARTAVFKAGAAAGVTATGTVGGVEYTGEFASE